MKKLLAIPSTFTADEKNLEIRTYKIGLIARAAATFGITDIGIYYDPDPYFDSHGLGRFIVKVLKYINTPPYLRKTAFSVDPSLKYIGIVEPLKTPHHLDIEFKLPFRYTYLKKKLNGYIIVTDGKRDYKVKKTANYREKEKIYVIDTDKKVIVDKHSLPVYFGYDVFYFNKGLLPLLRKLRKRGFLIIGTSRYGDDIRNVELKKSDKISIVFGSPFRGLIDMLGDNYRNYFDYFVNFIPDQNVKTIRVEEAVFYVLGILRYLNLL